MGVLLGGQVSSIGLRVYPYSPHDPVGLPWWPSGKEYACSAGDQGSISGSRIRQYSCLENPMDRGAGRATVHGVTKSRPKLTNATRCEGQGAACLTWEGLLPATPSLAPFRLHLAHGSSW